VFRHGKKRTSAEPAFSQSQMQDVADPFGHRRMHGTYDTPSLQRQ
jgi:hypothetical protein